MKRTTLWPQQLAMPAVVALAVGLLAACGTSAPDRQAAASPDTARVQNLVCMANATGHQLLVGPLPSQGTITLSGGETRCWGDLDDSRDLIVGDKTTGGFDRLRFSQVVAGQDTIVTVDGRPVTIPAGQMVDTGNYRFIRSQDRNDLTFIVSTVTRTAGEVNPLEAPSDAATPSPSATR